MEDKQRRGQITLPRKHYDSVMRVVEQWQHSGTIDEKTTTKLSDSITIASFDWRRTARYALLVAILCFVIAVAAILADQALIKLLMRIFNALALVKCGFFAITSAVIFRYALLLRKRYSRRLYSNESVFFLGVLALAAAIFFLGVAIDTGSALLGLWFPSALVWVFGLLSLGAWMETETGYLSGYGAYYLGMNYPLRFVIFGAGLTSLGIAGQHISTPTDASTSKARLLSMSPQTKVVGLLNMFIALWIMSIFGNYGDIVQWEKVQQYELFYWSLLFDATAIAAIWYSLQRDDAALRGFGLTFLFINLYTRFFEYFWNSIHKAAFFAILGVSFWYIGRRAEAIWHLGERKPQSDSSVQPTPIRNDRD